MAEPGSIVRPAQGNLSRSTDLRLNGSNIGLSDLTITVIDLGDGRPEPTIRIKRTPRSSFPNPADCLPPGCLAVTVTILQITPKDAYAIRVSTPGGEQSRQWRFGLVEPQAPVLGIPGCYYPQGVPAPNPPHC